MKTFIFQTCLMGIFVLVSLQSAYAETVTVKGSATIDYESGGWSSEPDKKDIKKAKKKAIKKAWKRYVSKFDGAKRKAYRAMKDDFLDELEEYTLEVDVIDKEIDEEEGTVTVFVRAEFDDEAVQVVLNESMPKVDGGGQYFSFLFVTRQQGQIKTKQDKVTSIESSESINSASEKVAASGGSVASLDKEKSIAKTVKGGNIVSSSEKVKWVIQGSKEIDVSINETLKNAGYEVLDYGEMALDPECGGGPTKDSIQAEFVKRVNMTSKTETAMKRVAKDCGVAFLATGTLDILKARKDPVTGKVLVTVSVTAKVFDTQGRFSKSIGSVGPVQYQGLGDAENDARNNALIKASKDAAEKIVNQLGMR